MSAASLAQLMLLGAIWGGAHALTRYSVPAFGPAVLVELRIGMAAVLLALVAWATSRPLRLRQQWRQIVVLGAVNTAVPFFLQAYAATTLNASGALPVTEATDAGRRPSRRGTAGTSTGCGRFTTKRTSKPDVTSAIIAIACCRGRKSSTEEKTCSRCADVPVATVTRRSIARSTL